MNEKPIYRVRPGFRGVSVLQHLVDSPLFVGGQVDASVRYRAWRDLPYDQAPAELKIDVLPPGTTPLQAHPCLTCKDYSDGICLGDMQYRDFSCRRPR